MPVAIQRLSAAGLPLRTSLDDSNGMMGARKLSDLRRWRIVARVSRSGNATPQPGDLEGSVELGLDAAGSAVRLVIDRARD
jgi:cytochrome c-type biogenesis protein CcmH